MEYSGLGLENMVGKADLTVTVRLWGGLKKSFNDYPIPIVVKEGIPPSFAEALEDLFVTPGTKVEYQYPEVVMGSNELKDVIIEAPIKLATFIISDEETRTIIYDGDAKLEEVAQEAPYDIRIVLVDSVSRQNVYFQYL